MSPKSVTARIGRLEKKLNREAFNVFLSQAKEAGIDLRSWAKRLIALDAAIDISEFVDYVFSFYGSGGIYDMGATRSQIVEAVRALKSKTPAKDIAWDSVDREKVRDILISEFGLKFPKPDPMNVLMSDIALKSPLVALQ